MKYYHCKLCGNVVESVTDSGVPIKCCGEEMELLVPNSGTASPDKHIPLVFNEDSIVRVSVGSIEHPSTMEHHIEWIAIKTRFGYQRKDLSIDNIPEAVFAILDCDEVIEAYAYCNLHGLWKC